MSNELGKIQNKLNDDASLKELREWVRLTKKMKTIIRRWPLNSTLKLDESLHLFMTNIEGLITDADNFEKTTGKKADNPEEPLDT